MPDQTSEEAYRSLLQHSRELTWTAGLQALLGWDQQVTMPPEAAEAHSMMSSIIARIVQRKAVDPRVGAWLQTAGSEEWALTESANLREWKRDYEKAVKLPEDFVAKQAELASKAYEVWQQARERNDFGVFAPVLAEVVAMARQEADYYQYDGERYDALLDIFEPGLTVVRCEALFADLRHQLIPVIREILKSQPEKPDLFGSMDFPADRQAVFNRRVAADLGFDFEAGRLDETIHPFTNGIACGDTRITTNYRLADPLDTLFSTIHETGHGLYEQGVSADGTPAGQACSMAVHESQSRLYENEVGKGRPFWQHRLSAFNREFGTSVDLDDVMRRVNRVEPGLIRIKADEVTYNLHIIIRFEIERDLLREEMDVTDMPRVWSEKYKEYLGVEVTDDLCGALQDVHWSDGLFGYFPTYALGNVYAAQLFHALKKDMPEVESSLAAGDFKTLHGWLREKIYVHGRVYMPDELIERATGSPVSTSYLIDYLRKKYLSM